MNYRVREAFRSDKPAIEGVVKAAFGELQGPEIVRLIADLQEDPSARPLLSLVTTVEDRVIGQILFTNARIELTRRVVSAAILAPLSVYPEYQGQGIGGKLIREGLKQLKIRGVELVFVLGYPDYYPKYGFYPADLDKFEAPYPIAPENADAWMVQELHPRIIGQIGGRVICAETLNDPKHWRE